MRFLLPLIAIAFAGVLNAAEEAAAGGLPAEAAGFAGTLVGTKVSFGKGALVIKVSEVTPSAASKATDASKLKDTEVSLAVAYDVKTAEGKWGVNTEQAAAAKAIAKDAKLTVEVKATKKGVLTMTAPPKAADAAEPKKDEAKPAEPKPAEPKQE